jgi:hypothetical protein
MMANPCTACSCVPYQNICCCSPQSGISVYQPRCQRLIQPCNGLTVVNNPCYCADNNTTTFTYKFFTECTPGPAVSAISNFLIPVCSDITAGSPANPNIIVEELIDGCGDFAPVAFTLSTFDGNFGNAPAGFQWLKVENPTPPEVQQRYEKGVSVEYRVTLVGDYPAVTQAIRVKAGQNLLIFCEPNPCFLVPGCTTRALSINKSCNVVIIENQATVIFNISVTNTGTVVLDPITFMDMVTLGNGNLIINADDIQIIPNTLTFNLQGTNLIVMSNNIGPLEPGQTFTAQYIVPVDEFQQPGTYQFGNIAMATAPNTQPAFGTAACQVQVAQASVQKTCSVVNGNEITFSIAINPIASSPAATVNVIDTISIPEDITVQFRSFGSCTANVPIDTDISDQEIILQCSNIAVPELIQIRLDVIEIRDFQQPPSQIINTVTAVDYANPNQVTLPVQFLQQTAAAEVIGVVNCSPED